MIDDEKQLGLTGIIGQGRTPNHYEELWSKVTHLLRDVAKRHTMYIWWLRGHLPNTHTHARYHNEVDKEARYQASTHQNKN